MSVIMSLISFNPRDEVRRHPCLCGRKPGVKFALHHRDCTLVRNFVRRITDSPPYIYEHAVLVVNRLNLANMGCRPRKQHGARAAERLDIVGGVAKCIPYHLRGIAFASKVREWSARLFDNSPRHYCASFSVFSEALASVSLASLPRRFAALSSVRQAA